jgi:hypothetical protein
MTARRAIWTPAWYGLDQTLVVGYFGDFLFHRDVEEDGALRFYNDLLLDEAFELRNARITRVSIAHWGDVHAVVANELDYDIYLMDGSRISVDTEERPGHVCELGQTLPAEAWITTVCLEDVRPSASSLPMHASDRRAWRAAHDRQVERLIEEHTRRV